MSEEKVDDLISSVGSTQKPSLKNKVGSNLIPR